MTIAGEKHYAQVISYIDRNQLFTDTGSSNSKVVNRLISGNVHLYLIRKQIEIQVKHSQK